METDGSGPIVNVQELLERLAELKDQQAANNALLDASLADILAPVQVELGNVLALWRYADEGIVDDMLQIEADIKAAVIAEGATVKGKSLMAVYTKGRETVDMKAFSGYCIAHPDAKALVKVGEPSVSIRGGKKE